MNAAIAVAFETKKPKRERGTGRIWLRGKTPWIAYYDSFGRQRRESVAPAIEVERQKGKKNIDELKVAEQLLRKRIGARENDILPTPKKSRVTVTELYEDKLAELKKQGKPKTADWMKSRWELRSAITSALAGRARFGSPI